MSRFFYLLREAFVSLRRNALIVVGAVMAVWISLTLAFAALVFNELIRINLQAWEEGVHVIAFLKDAGQDGVPADAHQTLLTEVEGWDEVENAFYVDKAEAWIEYQEIFAGQDELLDIDPSILPASIRIELIDSSLFQSIEFRLEQQQQVVRRVVTAGEQIEQWQAFQSVAIVLGGGAAIVLGIAAIVLISNTIRLAIYARRDEVEIMKLVGASNWYIRIPFLLEGLIEGLLGSALAVFMVWLGASQLANIGENFFIRFDVGNDFLFRWGLLVLAFGALAGVIGSLLGLSRYLRDSAGTGADVPTGTLERV